MLDSIITLSFNKLETTRRCLESVVRDTVFPGEAELIVVDNGSTDGSKEWLESELSKLCASVGISYHLIANATNVGCSTARNQALAVATGECITFIDNDVAPQSPDWLAILRTRLYSAPDIGMVGAKMLYPVDSLEQNVECGVRSAEVSPCSIPAARDGTRALPLPDSSKGDAGEGGPRVAAAAAEPVGRALRCPPPREKSEAADAQHPSGLRFPEGSGVPSLPRTRTHSAESGRAVCPQAAAEMEHRDNCTLHIAHCTLGSSCPRRMIQCAGVGISRRGHVCFLGRGEPDSNPAYSTHREVQCLISACMMIRGHLVRDYGGFDEGYNPVQFEDFDLCYRFREHGWKAWYEPSARMTHYESTTTAGSPSIRNAAVVVRNGLRFQKAWRHMFSQEDGPSEEECRWKSI